MTKPLMLGFALIGLAGNPAAANTCLPQHHSTIIHSAHFERAPRKHRHVRYVVVERPRYRTVFEEVNEPVPAVPYDEAYWRDPVYAPTWAAYDEPYWYADYYGGW